ncbi:MAG: hypothetical protein A3H06_00320 [Candidatus Colwellbacteria bacterium RIFCSPLOWO2_12_FULL_44_13]|uniref:Aspartate--tRNA(Asp/Asn) ligase n=3 Tax=Candidatus Colwelliibacteriota TaxID=1817904 RepID=A0A1G1Z6N3_9BACT|nr:MAG: hypothetical protein A3F24_02560 [Candidatus Colwellbacteria bacterium RIFCSPHIGHO2_12_FULL_44_17]OGY60278.1 MAG: hypothetical protein A3I31_00320 [Candidatus Colwellbacteria bacterium RIFCSPLOWO2_02_FULL_44_20b]OGY61537.1 MAG: hypothetical protein A3H06_00320 [Candidatus Colwellbacteria bacterium RIFCSPLOWO2_12_FULL_44_13]
MRTLTSELGEYVGKEVECAGWVDVRRDHGKIIFVDLRDRSGTVQLVFIPNDKETYEKASKLRSEWVIKIKGEVKERPANMVNPNIPTGKIEIPVTSLEILSESEAMPFEVSGDGIEINEEVRMKYRYLDLRRSRLQRNLRNRSKVTKFVRDFFIENGFTEIETPDISKSTPEGARDYLVPSRVYPGKFYALPQSPQQYKQLLMVAGLERYFQFARCFRDEDTRGDRQPEFTQLDLEMSFVAQEDVMAINEEALIKLVETLYPEKKIQEKPFPRITYKEAMEKYKTDRPDVRKDKNDPNLLAFCWVVDFPFFEKTDPSANSGQVSGWTFTHNPFSLPKPEFINDHLAGTNIETILTTQYDIVMNGYEIGGGSIRAYTPELLKATFKTMGFAEERMQKNFGHMLKALAMGAPPHGGIAWGFDRLMMLLQNEPNIREVIAFPKTGDGRDLLMDGPSEVDESQLKELHIKLLEPKK